MCLGGCADPCVLFPLACNCHGHAHDCYYDPEVDRRNASQNQDNVYQGGGVCIDCQVGCQREGSMGAGMGRRVGLDSGPPPPLSQHHTTGINCERCLPGFYRSPDQPLDSPHACLREWPSLGGQGSCTGRGRHRACPGPRVGSGPCGCGRPGQHSQPPAHTREAEAAAPSSQRCGACWHRAWGLRDCGPALPGCSCESAFTDGTCEDLTGRCYCRPNFTGERCDACAEGFVGFPQCSREAQLGQGCPAEGGTHAGPRGRPS